MLRRLSRSAAGGEEAGAATAGAACCSAGTARKMGCSMAIGKSSSFMTASCRAPSRSPLTASFASPAAICECRMLHPETVQAEVQLYDRVRPRAQQVLFNRQPCLACGVLGFEGGDIKH